eukprot:TRINITY_DN42664_c0_g1_i1.p1 TRINITY_DN42664_c0_g1~~TRINITY_DN42664_c0_g1_i1.p1  ORF type:complete len:206 (+),score=91.04 TRINITY_DN42664_c0_g1_i1:27-620(+)
MGEVDVTDLVGEHYNLLAALAEKDAARGNAVVEAMLGEIEGLEADLEMVPLVAGAIEGDVKELESRKRSRSLVKEMESKCAELREKVAYYTVPDEYTAKYDALIADLTEGMTIPEIQQAIAAERKRETKNKQEQQNLSEIESLKASLAQLYDLATAASSKCQYMLKDGDNDVKQAQKKSKRDRESRRSKDSASPVPK